GRSARARAAALSCPLFRQLDDGPRRSSPGATGGGPIYREDSFERPPDGGGGFWRNAPRGPEFHRQHREVEASRVGREILGRQSQRAGGHNASCFSGRSNSESDGGLRSPKDVARRPHP